MFCHELGQYEKQSSCWFQAKTALTEIKNSIMFNGPRAMINFNVRVHRPSHTNQQFYSAKYRRAVVLDDFTQDKVHVAIHL